MVIDCRLIIEHCLENQNFFSSSSSSTSFVQRLRKLPLVIARNIWWGLAALGQRFIDYNNKSLLILFIFLIGQHSPCQTSTFGYWASG